MLEAESPYHDEGSAIHWRLVRRPVLGKQAWVNASDPELINNHDADRSWGRLLDAKAHCQAGDREIREAIAREMAEESSVEATPPPSATRHWTSPAMPRPRP